MAPRPCGRTELLERWRSILEGQDEDDPSPSKQRQIQRLKEEWFSESFDFLVKLPNEVHIWCGYADLMGPLLETFHSYLNDKSNDSPLKLVQKRVSQEMRLCTQCICQYHQAQEAYAIEYESDTVEPLLKVLKSLDEERVTEHLKEINAKIRNREYNPENNGAEVVSLIFEVLTFPILFDDLLLVSEFQIFIEAIDNSHEVTLAGRQQYPGVYAMLFLKGGKARAIGLRLAGYLGKLRRPTDLEPLQPLLRKYIGVLETEVLPSAMDMTRPRLQLERLTVWSGIKTLLGFLEAPAFEEGILERYPIFLSIVLNHVSDDTPEFSHAVACLKATFEMLGCKLWLRTSLSPSMMRNTLLGQCFHTRNEKSHKEIFDLFLPFLQSLEALQDGEHEKQRRHLLYFLLHQVTQSSNFSTLMRKNACKIALLIIHRGYTLNPPCPPFECGHMWGPALVSSLKDSSLHSALRQPAFDLINSIIVSDVSAIVSLKPKSHNASEFDARILMNFIDDDEEVIFPIDTWDKDNCSWRDFRSQSKLASCDCKEWVCIPMLWFDVLIKTDPLSLPIPFSKAVFWALSHISIMEANLNVEFSMPIQEWLPLYAREISSSFVWEVPNGYDDGGHGKESRNSIKVSSMWKPLVRTFKRLAAEFIINMEKHELQKQWIWEPEMTESLILLLIDPNESIRQADRIVLEHVSKTRGLTSGLQFLCSSAASISAIFFGMKYALRKVEADPISANFHNFQHILFIIRKLLKEVITSLKTSASFPSHGVNTGKSFYEGGFLRQPCLEHLSTVPAGNSSVVVDIESWEKFCYLVSAIFWPYILKCIAEGREFVNSKNHQMTCVRLLEALPVIFERLNLPSSKLSMSSSISIPGLFDYKWLSDLVDWGKSSLVVIIRHWKQCMHSLLPSIRGMVSGKMPNSIDAIEEILSQDSIEIDVLKEKVLHLSISVDKTSATERTVSEERTFMFESSFGRKDSPPKSSIFKDRDVNAVQDGSVDEFIVLSDDEPKKMSPPRSSIFKGRDVNAVQDGSADEFIVLSDDESKKMVSQETVPHFSSMASPEKIPHSSIKSRQNFSKKVLPSGHGSRSLSNQPCSTSLSRDVLEPLPSRYLPEDTQTSYQRKSFEKFSCDKRTSGVESSITEDRISSSTSKVLGSDKGTTNVYNLSNRLASPKETRSLYKQPLPTSCQVSVQTVSEGASIVDLKQEKEAAAIRELIYDVENDPLEHALDSSRRRQSVLLTKPIVSVPKRKVIQIHLPMNNKYGLPNTADKESGRLKPAKLDDWYRPILEMDYFATVGMSNADEGNRRTPSNLKEVPLCFESPNQYVEIFRPLILEEFKAQLQSSFMETTSDEMCCGKMSVLSVERIDEFHLVRGRPGDSESVASRGCLENDLVLLTKEPLQNSAKQIHVLGKVERREKCDKSRSTILIIRCYLPNNSLRFSKVKSLLIERSKWSLSRIMSIIPQLREFQALSSLHEIPMLPVILDPVNHSCGHTGSKEVDLSKLPQPLETTLRSSFNNSQLQAISVAIKAPDSRRACDSSLIQGPPGTGKTKTIIGIVSALLAVHEVQQNSTSRKLIHGSVVSPAAVTNLRTKISQSAAVARAWQDAAFAKQLVKAAETEFSGPAEHPSRGRILICAQSNAAVDELVSRISEGLYGIDGKLYRPYMVRVGNVKTVHPSSLPFFLDTLVEERLAEDNINQANVRSDGNMEASWSLRAKLEKVVDSIRLYESRRAKLNDGLANMQSSLDDGSSQEDDIPEVSDAAIGAKLNMLYAQKRTICKELAAAHTREKKLSEESRALKHKIRKSILKEAEIVLTTLSGSGGDLYGVCSESASSNKFGSFSEQTLFDVVVIDEAAQALEPATLIPLQLLKSNRARCVMVGDPKQLPATVLSNVATKFLYECSMFERLQRAGHSVIMLTEQYRMHPEICKFPSVHFYDNKLLNGVGMVSKSAKFHELTNLGPYMFFDVTDGHEYHGKNSGSLSLFNEYEIEAAVEALKCLKTRYPSEFSSQRVGIITPYRSQLSLLRSRFSSSFGPNVVSGMEFNTIDGFQGREVDILVLSTVRSSQISTKESVGNKSTIGFVADVRRMNVALTRAKVALWIFGNANKLETNPHWAALIWDAKQRNLFISIARPYKSIFDKDLASSRESKLSQSSSLQQSRLKECEKAKDYISANQHTSSLMKETNKGKGKPIEQKTEVHARRHGSTSNLKQKKKSENNFSPDRVPQQDHIPCEDMSCSVISRLAPESEDEGKVSSKPKNKLRVTSRRDTKCTKAGNKSTKVDKPLETDSDIKNLIDKAKEARKISENAASGKSNQKSSLTLPTPSQGSSEVKEGSDSKSSISNSSCKDLIGTRKRQRDAVEALLSSALLPSKKPETTKKLPIAKRPHLTSGTGDDLRPSHFSEGPHGTQKG